MKWSPASAVLVLGLLLATVFSRGEEGPSASAFQGVRFRALVSVPSTGEEYEAESAMSSEGIDIARRSDSTATLVVFRDSANRRVVHFDNGSPGFYGNYYGDIVAGEMASLFPLTSLRSALDMLKEASIEGSSVERITVLEGGGEWVELRHQDPGGAEAPIQVPIVRLRLDGRGRVVEQQALTEWASGDIWANMEVQYSGFDEAFTTIPTSIVQVWHDRTLDARNPIQRQTNFRLEGLEKFTAADALSLTGEWTRGLSEQPPGPRQTKADPRRNEQLRAAMDQGSAGIERASRAGRLGPWLIGGGVLLLIGLLALKLRGGRKGAR